MFDETETPPQGIFFSRDFALLAGAVLCALLLLSGWVIFQTNNDFRTQMLNELTIQSIQLDRSLSSELQAAAHSLESLGHRIVALPEIDQKQAILATMRDYSAKQKPYFGQVSFINANQSIELSSKRGILSRSIDVSDRDYAKKAILSPWQVQIGRPVESRISSKFVLPIALGMENTKGEYLGSLLLNLDLQALSRYLRKVAITAEHIDFSVINEHFLPLLENTREQNFLLDLFPFHFTGSKAQLLSYPNTQPSGIVTFYSYSENYPFTYLLVSDISNHWEDFSLLLAKRMIPIVVILLFWLALFWLIRQRILYPLYLLGQKVRSLIRGKPVSADIEALDEIRYLDKHISRISHYLQERRNIEREQRGKIAFMKQAKEAAELSNRVKIDFLHAMSHELRIPLNTIAGFAELMKNQVYGVIDNEKYRQYIDDIYEGSNAVQELVGDVLALAKAEAGMLELQEKPVQVELVMAKCIRVLSDRLKATGVTIDNKVAETLPRLLVDELRLKQIILNLLGNAISHTPKGGTVQIDAQTARDARGERYFDIIVTDIGAKRLSASNIRKRVTEELDEETGQPRLKSRSQLGKVSNLGIPLTKALVAMHQATLTIESPPGKPTLVIVRFPSQRIVS